MMNFKNKTVFRKMKTKAYYRILPVMVLMVAAGCRKDAQETIGELPPDFNTRNDVGKVEYMMSAVSPDSVARFICDAALGKVEVAKIDTLVTAVSYAYQNYADSALVSFSQELDDYSAGLPLEDKMKIYSMVGKTDPLRLGYELGLEFVGHIRDKKMSVPQIEEEISAFRDACADDSITYFRFMKGFRTALNADHGKDLPEEVFRRFM